MLSFRNFGGASDEKAVVVLASAALSMLFKLH